MVILPTLAAAPFLAPPPGPARAMANLTAVQKGPCRLELNGKPLACAVVAYAFAPSLGRSSFNAAIAGDAFGFSGLILRPKGPGVSTLSVDTLVAHRASQSVHEPAAGQCRATTSPDHAKLLNVSCRATAKSGTWTLAFEADKSATAFIAP